MDIFYPQALIRLIRHAWDTVDLFYPRALMVFHTRARQRQDNDKTNVEPVHSYYPFHTRSDMSGVKGIIGIHRFNLCLVVVLSLSCSGVKTPLVTSYDISGIQLTYSIPEPLITSYDMSGIQWTCSIPGPLYSRLYSPLYVAGKLRQLSQPLPCLTLLRLDFASKHVSDVLETEI